MADFDFIGTYSNAKIHFNRKVRDLTQYRICDISRSLSMQCRFNGHIKQFYSVGEHSIILSDVYMALHPTDYAGGYAMQMHDASEAYLCDIPRPIKKYLKNYLMYEERLQSDIRKVFEVDEMNKVGKWLDDNIVRDEATQLFKYPPDWLEAYEEVGAKIRYYTPEQANLWFIEKFHEFRRILGLSNLEGLTY